MYKRLRVKYPSIKFESLLNNTINPLNIDDLGIMDLCITEEIESILRGEDVEITCHTMPAIPEVMEIYGIREEMESFLSAGYEVIDVHFDMEGNLITIFQAEDIRTNEVCNER